MAAVAYSFFSISLLQLRNAHSENDAIKPTLILSFISTAAWGWFGFLHVFWGQDIWFLLENFLDLVRYFFWILFFITLIRHEKISKGRDPLFNATFIFLVLTLVSFGLLPLLFKFTNLEFINNSQSLFKLAPLVYPLVALVLLEQIFFNTNEDIRWRIKPLCIGLASSFAFDLYFFSQSALFGYLDQDSLGVRGLIHALVLPLLWISLTRRNGNELKINFSPAAVFHTATLLIAGIYLLFISSLGYYVRFFGGDWGQALQIAIVFIFSLIFLVLFLSNGLRSKLRVFIGKNFFDYRFDYRDEWLNLTKVLTAKNSPSDMAQQVILGLAGMMKSPAGSLWTKKPDDDAFTQSAHWNHPHTPYREDADSAFCRFIRRTGWVVNLEEFHSRPSHYEAIKLPEWLTAFSNSWLVVPLKVGDDLIGFCVLDRPPKIHEVNWEVNDLLKVAGTQAGGFLAQMQATEAWLEVRKFDSFNRMSAFVVHDLKNIVTQLSLMMKNSKRLLKNPEFQNDMLLTVENSLERMRQLMLQLREGAFSGSMSTVNLSNVILRLVSKSEKNGNNLDLKSIPSVFIIGNEERVERILGHVVQNAFDATSAFGSVCLKLDRDGDFARIVVGDTGQGMSRDFVKDRLFKPFQSTKKFGMGIGAYEIFQYVQELGGRIDVQSELGKGTTVEILLPQFEGHANLHRIGRDSV